jgi:hypothetical protein
MYDIADLLFEDLAFLSGDNNNFGAMPYIGIVRIAEGPIPVF